MSDKDHALPRRSFLAGAGTLGFALAVQPIAASTIMTDSQSLQTGVPAIDTGSGTMAGYYARPAQTGGPLPLVIVIQEIFGVHEHIKDLCRRLAKHGYLAVAPELYFRHGNPAQAPDTDTLLRDIVAKVPDGEVQSDLDATWRWAGTHGADLQRAAVTGFCWGGRQSWLYAARNPALKAAAAWYGKLEGPVTDNMPRHPLDIVADLKVPVLGLYGAQDQSIPVASVEKMRAALKLAGKDSDIVIYPDAGHGFNADYRPGYNPKDAQDGWQKMLDWFARHGAR
ncbi:dienelactone hydrolase family protein [Chromobacterium sphagni]|uniref:Carboxymethylenebutenolidase n=1 Tax=Chromobacterium sphagni TaxID=1903179 RepID=A0A1S1WW57_9NEIS|nr:dienelactone hydrolase family protein [Chromobacterium sphagni]OHX11265.1 carboxymethylenebutenolidase [Chromobacterium sphagni]OHX16729.1 carboxymethylenebutenolidase [Chromobacterium sphagni]